MTDTITRRISSITIDADNNPSLAQYSLRDMTVNKRFSSVHIEKDTNYITKKNESFDFIDVLMYRNNARKTMVSTKRNLSCCQDEVRIKKRRTFYKWSVPKHSWATSLSPKRQYNIVKSARTKDEMKMVPRLLRR